MIDKYNLFIQFVDTFLPSGFTEVDPVNPILQKIEKMTEANNQFFFVCDLLKVKILFTSKRSSEMIGIESEDVDPRIFFTITHPDDLLRHNIARTKLFNLGQKIFIEKGEKSIISTNFRFDNGQGEYRSIMVQCYLFYSDIPYKTVFMLQVMTDLYWFKKIKHGYHYYLGSDLSVFRFPTEDILLKGNIFSDCEFKILQLLATGLSTEEIAAKLIKSIHTISTHRRNILKKTGSHSTQELILDLKVRGFL